MYHNLDVFTILQRLDPSLLWVVKPLGDGPVGMIRSLGHVLEGHMRPPAFS